MLKAPSGRSAIQMEGADAAARRPYQGSYGSISGAGVVVVIGAGVGDGAGFMTGMNGGFDDGSRLEGGKARSTTVMSPAA